MINFDSDPFLCSTYCTRFADFLLVGFEQRYEVVPQIYIYFCFILGQVQGGTRGYLKSMGFLHQNLLIELRRSKKAKETPAEVPEDDPEGAEEETDASATVGDMPGRNGERNRLVELQTMGLGQKSFSYSSPFKGRKTGLSARMQASQENRTAQELYDLRGKACLKCEKRFVDGALLKSRVIKCQSCHGYVHEKSGGCSVNLTRGNPVSFACPACSEGLETG